MARAAISAVRSRSRARAAAKAGKNRLHLDLFPTGRDNALPVERRIEIVEAEIAELIRLGASVESRTRHAALAALDLMVAGVPAPGE